MALDVEASAMLPCDQQRAHVELRVLDDYPTWLGIVSGVIGAESQLGDPGPAWWVDLGAGLGPVRRTKRVRMTRTVDEVTRLQFERRELDGNDHSKWELAIGIDDRGLETRITVRLQYAGRLPPLVDRVLAVEMGRAGGRLARRIAAVG